MPKTRSILRSSFTKQGRKFTCLVSAKRIHDSYNLLITTGKCVSHEVHPPPIIDGARINSPHYLCKIITPKEASASYTLVISQYSKSTTIHYSLRAYSTIPFTLSKHVNPFKYTEKVMNGQWTESTAGGCANNRDTYKMNPVYQLEVSGPVDADNQVLIDLKGPK